MTEIKSALNLPSSSVHNMLQTMVSTELLSMSGGYEYVLGPRAIGTAFSILGSLDIKQIARKQLLELAQKVGDSVYLALRAGDKIFYADRMPGTQRISLDIRLGEPLFLHCTATGKLFAAFDPALQKKTLSSNLKKLTPFTLVDKKALEREFDEIRNLGYSKSNQEAVEGVIGYAIPVHQKTDQVIAAIHISVIEKRGDRSHEIKLIEEALECARQIEKNLGNFSF